MGGVARADAAAEGGKARSLAEQLKDRDRRIKEIQQELDMVRTAAVSGQHGHPRVSPTPSQLSQFSVNGSTTDQFTWPVRSNLL